MSFFLPMLFKRNICYLLLCLSIFSVVEMKPQPIDFSVLQKGALSIMREYIPGMIAMVCSVWLSILLMRRMLYKPLTQTDAIEELTLTGEEVFDGEVPYGVNAIFRMLKTLNEKKKEKKLSFAKEKMIDCHLFYGGPGTGKTHAVSWLLHLLQENNIKVPFYIKKKVLDTGYAGAGPNTVIQIMNMLWQSALKTDNKVAILVLDEADSVVRSRYDNFGSSAPTVNAFLEYMDGVNKPKDVLIIVIAITNHFENLDSAFISRGNSYEFKASVQATMNAVKRQLGDDFLDKCEPLKLALKQQINFAPTGEPLSIRDIGMIKKSMYQHCCVNDKKFKEANKAELFNSLYKIHGNKLCLTIL